MNPAQSSAIARKATSANSEGLATTSSRSNLTTHLPGPRLTRAKGTVWIWPLSATEQIHSSSGGASSVARMADMSFFAVSHVLGPTAYCAFGLFGGADGQSAR
jgi:hypothetical protein